MLALALGACLAPTLPIPPPSDMVASPPDANGMVTIKGGPGSARVGGWVNACNETDGCHESVGSDVASDGSWQLAPTPGKSKDRFRVWQELGLERGEQGWVDVP